MVCFSNIRKEFLDDAEVSYRIDVENAFELVICLVENGAQDTDPCVVDYDCW
jgi:hypothetical protein